MKWSYYKIKTELLLKKSDKTGDVSVIDTLRDYLDCDVEDIEFVEEKND